MNDVALSLRGIKKTFGTVQALRGVDLDLRAGEVLALMGDNGAGKSTLVNIACGNIVADEGDIRLNKEEMTEVSVRRASGLGLEVVYQDLALAPDLSVLENIYLGHELVHSGIWRHLGWLDRRRMAEVATEHVKALGVNLPSMYEPVVSLSGGQRQAVAIARAVMWAEHALLLDEPTAALGVKQSAIVEKVMKSAAARGLGVLLVSHDVPAVQRTADRVAVLYRGRIAMSVSTEGLSLERIVGAMVGQVETDEP